MNDHDPSEHSHAEGDDDERGFSHKAHSIQLAEMLRLCINIFCGVVFVGLAALVAWVLLRGE